MKHTEQELKKLSETLALSASEKDTHKDALRSFMREHPAMTPSPFAPFAFGFFRYALAIVVVLAVTGTGVTFASEGATPGDALYVVKVKVNEPARIALTRDPEKRADLEVALVDRRLTEFAEASAREDVDEGVTDLVVESLSDRLEDAHGDILTLRAEGVAASAALDTAVDLYSTLSAHTEVLTRVSEENPESFDDIKRIRNTIASHITITESVRTALRRAVNEGESDASVGVAIMAKQGEAAGSLEAMTLQVAADTETFDDGDRHAVDDAITQIRNVVEAASEESGRGDRKKALRLYGEVDEQVTRLRTLIEADQSLGLDIIERSRHSDDEEERVEEDVEQAEPDPEPEPAPEPESEGEDESLLDSLFPGL